MRLYNSIIGVFTILIGDFILPAHLVQARRPNKSSQRAAYNSEISSTGISHAVDVPYSSDEAGAYLTNSVCTSVTGTIVVPTIPVPSSNQAEYALAAWVGIDGITSTSAMVQVGLEFYVDGGEVATYAWYEWYPDYAYVVLFRIFRHKHRMLKTTKIGTSSVGLKSVLVILSASQ